METRDKLFFPEKGHNSEAGKKICNGIEGFKYRKGRPPCPVRDECLEYALTFPDGDLRGVWGGTTENERKAIQHQVEVRGRRISA